MALTALAVLAGCGRDRPQPAVEVVDSAGIRMVRNHRPARDSAAAWSVEERPAQALELEAGDAGPDAALAIRRLPDGRLAVLDGRARRLRVASPGGPSTEIELPGSEGGASRPATLVGVLPGDTLAVHVTRGPEIHLVAAGGGTPGREVTAGDAAGDRGSADGRGRRSLRLAGPGRGKFTPRVHGVLSDGTLVASPRFDRVVFPGGKVLRDTVPLLTFDRRGALGGTLDRVATAERFFARVSTGGDTVLGRIRRPFARATLVAATGSTVAVADNRTLSWRAFGAGGGLRVRSAAPFRHRPVEAADIAAYRDSALARAPAGYGGLRRKLLREVPFPGRKPVLGALEVDAVGHVWAGLARGPWTPPTTWRVFAPDGRWLGTVETPGGLEVQQVGEDFVAGIRRRPDGTAVAAVHRLRKPGPGGAGADTAAVGP